MVNEEAIYRFCRAAGIPYFGSHLHATQGDSRRHIYMQALVESQAIRRPGETLRILEIGSWAGGSAITWGASLKAFNQSNGVVVCVDPWKPYFDPEKISALSSKVYREMADAIESGEIYQLFLHNIRSAGLNEIVIPLRGESTRILPLLGQRTFDIIFIDGDHAYDAVKQDLQFCSPLLADGGILCGDDLEAQLSAVDDDFNKQNLHIDYIQDPKSGSFYHPGVTRALSEFFTGTVSSYEGLWVMRKTSQHWESVNIPPTSRYSVPDHLAGSTKHATIMMFNYARERGVIT